MDKLNFKCTVTFNRNTHDRSQRYFLVRANTKVQAILLLLDFLVDNNFLTVNLSGIRIRELVEDNPVIELAE